jgi:DNA invertase Pin-like site-specific DNA recombinase
MQKIGYARVSLGDEQSTQLQSNALERDGCDKIFTEAASGGTRDRPILELALKELRHGDVFVVWKLDRLSRSLRDLIFLLEEIERKGAGFRSLTEAIDTTTASGRLMAQLLGAFAEFERGVIQERTKAGMQAAKERGTHTGRPKKIAQEDREKIASKVRSGEWTQGKAARLFGVHRTTIARLLSR